MKGQIVSYFIVDHAVVESHQQYVEIKPWRLFFDASTHKEGSGVRILIISPEGIPTKLKFKIEGPLCSNNEIEYEALLGGLEALLELGATRVEIKGDSELVIKQLTKEYKCIKENLIMYFVMTNRLLKKFEYVDLKHVPRIKNQETNNLAQLASGYKVSKERLEELIQVRGKAMATRLSPTNLENTQLGFANQEEFEVLNKDALTDTYWRSPVVNYLKEPSIDTKKKIKYRALSYFLMGNELFKKTPEGILLKCIGETEAYLALSSVHSGTCGAHQFGNKVKWLLFRYGMYWPIMLKDCIDFAKGCQECQMHASIQHSPTNKLSSIIKPRPFRGWALDLIGEIQPTSSKGQRYTLVGIDYFTKWVEAVPLVNVDQEVVIEFIQKQILYIFGIPESITIDQGSVFTGRKMQELAKEMGVTSRNLFAVSQIQKQEENPPNVYWEIMMNELVDLDEERLRALEMIKRQKERVARAYIKKIKRVKP
ncbi:uncharacterized protein LOC131632610 [Vicia villosa]|uniref:uncharacterized protein LOC131632610 n=1 Tax=Vicia villosa TaxID=3911 RepID=UPI00273C27B3|nr:uncharacterized protein LOC131632610 [Vicia villosa]